MVVDQETQTTETVTDDSLETGSSSSTTETSQPGVDLAGGVEQTDEVDGQETETRTPEQIAADDARAELFGAPEGEAAYEISDLPEGMEIDKEALDAVTPAFKELGLSSKGASLIAKTYAETVLPQVMQRATSAIEQQVVAQRAAWEQDAEQAIKSNGADLKNAAGETLSFDANSKDAVLKTAAKALDRLAPAGFREWLKETGLSQHPMMVSFAYNSGKAIAEETNIEPVDGGSKPKSRVEKYYPTTG